MNEQLQKVPETILQEPVRLSVDIRAANKIHGLLQRWKWLPKERIFTIYPIVAGSLIKISKLLLSMDVDPDTLKDANSLFQNAYKQMEEHTETMAKILAIAFVNRNEDPSQRLINFILNNFTSKEIKSTIGIVVSQMDVVSFTSSIISVRAMNLLQMSPQDQGS